MQTLATLTRHGITYLVGLLVAWLTVHLTLPEAAAASAAAHAIIEPLVLLAGFVGVVLSRLAMPVLMKIFRNGAGEKSGRSPGVEAVLLPMGIIALGMAAVLGALPSCSPAYPLAIPVTFQFSPDGGMSLTARLSGK